MITGGIVAGTRPGNGNDMIRLFLCLKSRNGIRRKDVLGVHSFREGCT